MSRSANRLLGILLLGGLAACGPPPPPSEAAIRPVIEQSITTLSGAQRHLGGELRLASDYKLIRLDTVRILGATPVEDAPGRWLVRIHTAGVYRATIATTPPIISPPPSSRLVRNPTTSTRTPAPANVPSSPPSQVQAVTRPNAGPGTTTDSVQPTMPAPVAIAMPSATTPPAPAVPVAPPAQPPRAAEQEFSIGFEVLLDPDGTSGWQVVTKP